MADPDENTYLTELNPFEMIQYIFLKSPRDEINNSLFKFVTLSSTHPAIIDEPNASPPDWPDREQIATQYVNSISRLKVMRSIFRQKAELSGKIDQLVFMEYNKRLRDRAWYLHTLLSKKNLFDISKLNLKRSHIFGDAGAVRVVDKNKSRFTDYGFE